LSNVAANTAVAILRVNIRPEDDGQLPVFDMAHVRKPKFCNESQPQKPKMKTCVTGMEDPNLKKLGFFKAFRLHSLPAHLLRETHEIYQKPQFPCFMSCQ